VNKSELARLLRSFRKGTIPEAALMRRLGDLGTEWLGYASIDHHREVRRGFPEVIFCQGKTPSQVAGIAASITRQGHPMLATRAGETHARAVKRKIRKALYDPVSRTITVNGPAPSPKRAAAAREGKGTILVISAGTSDIPVAQEAAVTARMFGHRVETLYDVGVAGIHRLLSRTENCSHTNRSSGRSAERRSCG
jgi:NCAIR mutase (PurE)-related protein